MRVMGLDYGEKTVGVALSDELLITAQPYETVVRDNPRQLRKTPALSLSFERLIPDIPEIPHQ